MHLKIVIDSCTATEENLLHNSPPWLRNTSSRLVTKFMTSMSLLTKCLKCLFVYLKILDTECSLRTTVENSYFPLNNQLSHTHSTHLLYLAGVDCSTLLGKETKQEGWETCDSFFTDSLEKSGII